MRSMGIYNLFYMCSPLRQVRRIVRVIARQACKLTIVEWHRPEHDAFPLHYALSIAYRLKTGFFAVLIKALQAKGVTHTLEVRPVAVPLPKLLI